MGLFLTLAFNNLIMMCLRVIFFVSIPPTFIRSAGLWLSSYVEVFQPLFLQILLLQPPPLLLDSNYMYVRLWYCPTYHWDSQLFVAFFLLCFSLDSIYYTSSLWDTSVVPEQPTDWIFHFRYCNFQFMNSTRSFFYLLYICLLVVMRSFKCFNISLSSQTIISGILKIFSDYANVMFLIILSSTHFIFHHHTSLTAVKNRHFLARHCGSCL